MRWLALLLLVACDQPDAPKPPPVPWTYIPANQALVAEARQAAVGQPLSAEQNTQLLWRLADALEGKRDPYFCGKHAIIYDSLEVLSEDDLRDDSTEIAQTFARVIHKLNVLGEEN